MILANAGTFSALRGRLATYVAFGAVAVLGALLPVAPLLGPEPRKGRFSEKKKLLVLLVLLAAEGAALVSLNGEAESPMSALVRLGREAYANKVRQEEISARAAGLKEWAEGSPFETFFKAWSGDFRQRPEELGETPNILLVFTEGLSQSIVEDARDIMPNVRRMEGEAIFFENYYDHTAATFRGLQGQLFSGHQLSELDENHLISLQSILKDKGYHTVFLNPEPANGAFTAYLECMGFDEVRCNELVDSYSSDREMYDLMYRTFSEADGEKPQLITMYTYGTHVSLDSRDEKFGDGSDRILNKFANVDYQFGQFMDRLRENGLLENTLVVFTADHATYLDDDYWHTFPDNDRKDDFCDRIPLLIWYEGVKPEGIDVNGRNSLGLAPTLLDILDIDAPNFFLGDSLFTDDLSGNAYFLNTTFSVPDQVWNKRTAGNVVRKLRKEKAELLGEIQMEYFACAAAGVP